MANWSRNAWTKNVLIMLIKQTQLPAGVIRSSFGKRVVMLVDSWLPFSRTTEMVKLGETLSEKDQKFQYWLFSVTQGSFRKTKKTLKINTVTVKGKGFKDYDKAEKEYVKWSESDSNKKVEVRGLGWDVIKTLG